MIRTFFRKIREISFTHLDDAKSIDHLLPLLAPVLADMSESLGEESEHGMGDYKCENPAMLLSK